MGEQGHKELCVAVRKRAGVCKQEHMRRVQEKQWRSKIAGVGAQEHECTDMSAGEAVEEQEPLPSFI